MPSMDFHSVHDPSPHSVGTILPPRQHLSTSVSSSLPHGTSIANGGVRQYQIPDGTGGVPLGPMMSSSLHHFSPHNPSAIASVATNPHNQPTPTNGTTFDPRNLEIKTRSVEHTLLPLVQQISTLVTFQKESIITGSRPKSERALRAALKIGTAVEAAVERFVAVGETIADENPDIQPELYDACNEARMAGSSIANLHNSLLAEERSADHPPEFPSAPAVVVDSAQLVRAARQLLSSVTRVLLLADRVLVKHILRAEDKIAYSLTKLEHTANFSEFVQIFTEFGNQMVDLAHRSGDRQEDLKSEKRRAQMQVARAQLERLTMLLLTSSKTLLRHPPDTASRQCRDGVFHQIRSALQLVAICVTDGVMPFDASAAYPSPLDELSRTRDGPLDIGIQLTASVAIRQLCEMMSLIGMMPLIGSGVRERLISALNALCEMSADFTESVWTPVQQREQILDLLEECRFEMGNLVNPPQNNVAGGDEQRLQNGSNEITVERLNRRLKDLRKQLQVVALEQIATVFRQNEDQAILSSLKTCSISGDIDGVERFLEQFRLHAEHLQEVCRLLHHISLTDALHVFTGHAERNLRALAPLTLLAGRVLCVHPSSRIARENLEVFCDTWAINVNDLARMSKELDAACSGRLAAEKQAYMSLPRPGVSLPLVSPSPVSSRSSACAVPMLSHNPSSSFSSIMSKSVLNSVSDCGDVVVVHDSCALSNTLPSQQCANNMQKAVESATNGTRTTPIPSMAHLKKQSVPNSDSGYSQTIANDERERNDTSFSISKGKWEEEEERSNAEEMAINEGKRENAATKEKHLDDKEEKRMSKRSKDQKKSFSKSLSVLWRRMRGEEAKTEENERKKGQENKGNGRKTKRPNSVENLPIKGQMDMGEEGFSKSLKVELEREMGKTKSERSQNCNLRKKDDPLYSTIRKSTAVDATKQMEKDPMKHAIRLNSAFTAINEFSSKCQQRGRNGILPFAVTPPRPRRMKAKEADGIGKTTEDERGMVLFNRIYGREEEPVIVRQQKQKKRVDWPEKRKPRGEEEEEHGRVVVHFDYGKGRKTREHQATPLLSRKSQNRMKAPLAKWDETEEGEERTNQDEDEGKVATAPRGRTEQETEEIVVHMRSKRPTKQTEERKVEGAQHGETEDTFKTTENRTNVTKSPLAKHGDRKFEQRISQILESLQQEAESLIRLQQGRQGRGEDGEEARHGTTSKPTKPITLDVEDQQKIAKVGLEMKLLTAEVEAEAEKWDEYAENDIVKRAKAMSAMSYNMYLFTKGDGPLKTTHDLFTQAEFFAEQANKMHKTVMEFAFEVPGSAEKNELLQILDKIPFHCQQLQVLVKSPTVGKSATFSKVDAVISETKGLMNEIAKLVTACFVCATKFEIEFRGTVGPRSGIGDDDLARGYSSQRASRESSAVWRRTPSMRRPFPQQHSPQFLTTATGGGSTTTATQANE
ncbi:hypothetical protein niasHT_007096 [Heterodera trifolii]|uniref:Alpha-catulin n=1 Tax=Heterodera trifolii TaxID=157864 RepID=A0ABD2LY11_9BILA